MSQVGAPFRGAITAPVAYSSVFAVGNSLRLRRFHSEREGATA